MYTYNKILYTHKNDAHLKQMYIQMYTQEKMYRRNKVYTQDKM